MKYWDKFVRRKTKQKYRDQVDEETLIAVLGEDKPATDTTFDYRSIELRINLQYLKASVAYFLE